MIPLPMLTLQTDCDIPQAVQAPGLGVEQNQQLLPTGKSLDVFIALVIVNTLFEVSARK